MHPYVTAIFALLILWGFLHLPALVRAWAEFAESPPPGANREDPPWQRLPGQPRKAKAPRQA